MDLSEFCKQCSEKCVHPLKGTIVLKCVIYDDYLKSLKKEERKNKKQELVNEKIKILEEIKNIEPEKIVRRRRKPKVKNA